jgi:hypothetical protein
MRGGADTEIIEKYLQALRGNFEIMDSPYFPEYRLYSTPWLLSEGQNLVIGLREITAETLLLSDLGETLRALIQLGISFNKGTKSQELLDALIKEFSISINGMAIEKIVNKSNVGQEFDAFIESVRRIDNMSLLSAAASDQHFARKIDQIIKKGSSAFVKRYKVKGYSSEHHFDYYLEDQNALISLLNNPGTINSKLFEVIDVQKNAPNYSFISILNPDKKWSSAAMEKISSYTQLLSTPEKLSDFISH